MTYVLRSEEVLFYRDEFLLAVQDKYVEKRLKQPYGNFDIILIGAFPGVDLSHAPSHRPPCATL